MLKSPAYQWYPKDILTSLRVMEMTLEEEGAYRRALDICWLHESLPSDPEKLAKVIGKGASQMVARVVSEMFTLDSSDATRLRHDRLDLERQKQAEWRKKSARGGRASANKRKKTKEISSEQGGSILLPTNEQPTPQPNGNTPVSSLQSAFVKNLKNDAEASNGHKPVGGSPLPKNNSSLEKVDARAKHPAIVAFRDVTKKFPDKDFWDRLITRFGGTPDVDKLQACWLEWKECGYNKNSMKWLNWYFDGIPERKNGTNQNNSKRTAGEIIANREYR